MYTGNSISNSSALVECAVYPCVYRELRWIDEHFAKQIGLSLCIQGTRLREKQDVPDLTVYPCVYRELTDKEIDDLKKGGLSLCIQGTLAWGGAQNMSTRFIPVYTGNSVEGIIQGLNIPVYPCVYRELNQKSCSINYTNGLSLCIQGTPVENANKVLFWRFIPVYTGNSSVIS